MSHLVAAQSTAPSQWEQHYIPTFTAGLLRGASAHGVPAWDRVEIQILMKRVWVGHRDSSFLIAFQVMSVFVLSE